MRSLFYMADRSKLVEFEKWDMERPFPKPTEEDLFDYESLAAYTARDPRAGTEEEQARRWQEARPSESECQAGYEVFKELCHDQTEIERQGYDQDCLRVLFEGCPKLREVTVASENYCIRQLDASRVFAKAMTKPNGSRHWWTENVHQTLSVAMAADRSGRKLDSLTLVALSPAIFDKHSSVGADQWCALKTVVQPLRRLRLYLQADSPDEDEEEEPDEDEPDYEQIYSQFVDSFENGHAYEILSAASNLRVLKLQLPSWNYHDHIEDTYGQLEPVLQDVTYPHLYQLSLSQCEVHADYLVDLCMRHRSTLRRLSLSDILLLDDHSSFREVFTRLSGQLPNLRKVELRGTFYGDLEPTGEFTFDHQDLYLRTDPFRDALVNFIVKGGKYPDRKRLGSPQYGIPDKSHVPPGLPDDDKNPDDQALDHDSDEFDFYL